MQIAALGVAAVAVIAVVFFLRDDGTAPAKTSAGGVARIEQPDRATAYLAASVPNIAAVTSYDYRRLDDALSAGLSVTTGAYQRSYRQALTGQLRSTALKEHVVQTFEQLRIGIGAIADRGATATVLVFGTERRTSTAGSSAEDVTLSATIAHRGSRYLISDLVQDANAGLPPGSPGLRAAAEAGRSEVINVNSYRRSNFDADYRRALAGAGGPLRTRLQASAAGTKAALRTGNYDLSGAVTSIAVESAAPTSVVLLIAATGLRVAPDGTRTSVSDVRFEVTVHLTSGTWLTMQVTPVRGRG